MKKLFATTALVAMMTGSAFAADIATRPYTKAPILAPAYNWTGFYIGGGAGYGAYVGDQRTYLLSGLPDANPATMTGGGQGWFGTVVGGYDLQFADRLVAGVFADYDFSDVKGKNLNFSSASIPQRGPTSAWSVGGRLGFLVSPVTLLYATGGYTHADFRGGSSEFIAVPFAGNPEDGTSQGGTFVGAGVETMLWQNLSGRLEYRYASYDAARGTRYNILGVPQGLTETEPSVQTIRATLAYKFGTPGIGTTYSTPAAPAFSWTGFYLGGGIGYGVYGMDTHAVSTFGPTQRPYANGGKGVLGTIVGGYDVQFADRWVAGIFADYDFASASGTGSIYSPSFDEFYKGTIKQNAAWAVGGRLGYLVTPQTLAYATGGYTEAEFDSANFSRANVNGSAIKPVVSGQTFSGWFVGAGAETQLSSNWYARLEYRYAEYDAQRLQIPLPPSALIDTIEFKPAIQTIRAGITYKFGGGPVVTKY